ncbi:MAG: NrfD/PsrC family molybdoenzyme membrane anchor subunit [bacterium]
MSESSQAAPRSLFTPFNVIAALILLLGGGVGLYRFVAGLGASTNLTHANPWGLWIGFDVMTGVALAAGGFTISSAVYLFGLKEFKPLVRPAILTGFLGYFLVVVGLLVDLGRPWRLPYPFVVQAGPTSALFEIALCVALYLTVLFVEFTPAAFEWLGWKRWRRLVGALTIALTIFGLILSTMHQSTLGAMYLITPTKLHPLWYSPHIPVHFFVSAVVAGLSMVIFESMLSHRVFSDQVEVSHEQHDNMTFGLAKASCVALGVYLAIKVVSISLDYEWALLLTPMGHWYLFEIGGFVILPMILFAIGFRERLPSLIRATALITVIGVVLNRLNVSIIAFNWELPAGERYVPHWMEITVTVALVTFGVVLFKWIVNRMPILREHPEWRGEH